VVLDPFQTESLPEVHGCATFGSVTLPVGSHAVCAKRVLAGRAVPVPPSAVRGSEPAPARKLVLRSGREALQSVCKREACQVLQKEVGFSICGKA